MLLKIKLDEGAYMPERAHEVDAGLDLRTPVSVVVPAHGYTTIDTGVHMAIPAGYYARIAPKSGLNVRSDIITDGIIDAEYTGSFAVKLYCLGSRPKVFNAGDKIAQIIIEKCEYPELVQVDELEETERGDAGFGSTGR